MIKNLKLETRNRRSGVTLVEIIVVVFVIGLFTMILVSDFPQIQKRYALFNTAYRLSQDMRVAQDLGLSGITIYDVNKVAIAAKGYGIYINLSQSNKQYVIYADVDGSQEYNGGANYPLCGSLSGPQTDCVINMIDLSKTSPYLYIKGLNNISGAYTSVNFSPPGPIIKIGNLNSGQSSIGIELGLTSDVSLLRRILVNTSGLIETQ